MLIEVILMIKLSSLNAQFYCNLVYSQFFWHELAKSEVCAQNNLLAIHDLISECNAKVWLHAIVAELTVRSKPLSKFPRISFYWLGKLKI